MERLRADLKRFLDRVFIERELFLRANDKVRYLRLSTRLQKSVVGGLFVITGWLLYSSAGLVLQRDWIADRDDTIQQQKLAYLELLTEVGEYHEQFARLTQNLETNQGYLLSLLENGEITDSDGVAVLDHLTDSQTERAQLALTREGLRDKVEAFEGELGAIADRSETLQAKIAQLRSRLGTFEVAELDIQAARERLGARLREMEASLAKATRTGELLRGELDVATNELAASQEARAQLEAENAKLGQRIAALDQQLFAAQDEGSRLNSKVVELRQILGDTDKRRNALEHERSELMAQAADLNGRVEQAGRNEKQLKARLTSLEGSLAETSARGETLQRERDELLAQAAELEDEVEQAGLREERLGARIASLEGSLAEASARGESLERTRTELQARITGFEKQVADAAATRADLERRIASLDGQLGESRQQTAQLEQERSERQAHVATLEEQLGGAAGQKAALEARIGELEVSLAESQERGERSARERNFYEARVTGLEKQLDDMREIQEGIVKRLTSQTLSSLDAMEKTVAMTGIDVNSLLSNVATDDTRLGQGGPFVPGDFISETDPTYALQASVALLDLQMDRWEALQKVVRQLPLVAPLDTYRVTSGYGVRIDPINNRKARHLGLDFSAPLRSPVFSTAPGKVVFAGWRGRYGRLVEIDHGLGIRTRYAHLKKILVQPGQEVGHHEQIGLLGSSGRSTGPHVHYEIRVDDKPVDPSNFLEAGRYVFKG